MRERRETEPLCAVAYHKFNQPDVLDSGLELSASVVFQPKEKKIQLESPGDGAEASAAMIQGDSSDSICWFASVLYTSMGFLFLCEMYGCPLLTRCVGPDLGQCNRSQAQVLKIWQKSSCRFGGQAFRLSMWQYLRE